MVSHLVPEILTFAYAWINDISQNKSHIRIHIRCFVRHQGNVFCHVNSVLAAETYWVIVLKRKCNSSPQWSQTIGCIYIAHFDITIKCSNPVWMQALTSIKYSLTDKYSELSNILWFPILSAVACCKCTGVLLAAASVATNNCQLRWPTYAVIGSLTNPGTATLLWFVVQEYPTVLCSTPKSRSKWIQLVCHLC